MGAFVCLLLIAGAEPDHLALAAEYLDRGDSSQAIEHLSVHVRSHPQEAMTRAYLAELLYRANRNNEAATEFESFVSLAQSMTGKPQDHLVHCHTRLMNLAAANGDDYREPLHRGIGLYRLVLRWDADPARKDAAVAETTLLQALEALKNAALARPKDARVQLYIAEVATRLNQRATAQGAIRKAKSLAAIALTPTERERLSTFD